MSHKRARGYRGVGRKFEHIAVAERALGRPLPPKAVVHHHDLDKANNHPSNLVICPDQRYHFLLHLRMRALAACGNPDFRRCYICKQYGDPATMYVYEKHGQALHKKCNSIKGQQRRKEMTSAES